MEKALAGPPSSSSAGARFDTDIWQMRVDSSGPARQGRISLRRPVVLRDTTTFSRTFHYANYFDWMGKLREISVRPVYEAMTRDLASGIWGLVTNNSELWITGEATPNDVIEGSIWIDRISGRHESIFELSYEWHAGYPSGQRRIAVARMKAAWAAITGRGTAEIAPFPAYMHDFLQALLPDVRPTEPLPPPVQVERDMFGSLLGALHAPPGLSKASVHEYNVETTTLDSNLVGNIYYANYYVWCGRAVESWLYSVAPQTFLSPLGELRCVRARFDHLREGMPFDRLTCRLTVGDVWERGVRFYVEMFRVMPNGAREKLGFGEYEGLWVAPNRGSAAPWGPEPLPVEIRTHLLARLQS